jgi:hypothetical protein
MYALLSKLSLTNSPLLPPLGNKYKINNELNTLSKQNTAPEIFKSHAHDIMDNSRNTKK